MTKSSTFVTLPMMSSPPRRGKSCCSGPDVRACVRATRAESRPSGASAPALGLLELGLVAPVSDTWCSGRLARERNADAGSLERVPDAPPERRIDGGVWSKSSTNRGACTRYRCPESRRPTLSVPAREDAGTTVLLEQSRSMRCGGNLIGPAEADHAPADRGGLAEVRIGDFAKRALGKTISNRS